MEHRFRIAFPTDKRRIETSCLVSAAWDPTDPSERPPLHLEGVALWDTGATQSAVSKRVADILNLSIEGYVPMQHAMGQTDRVPIHHVNLRIPIVYLSGVEVSQGNFGAFDVIIGMDIITMVNLFLENKQNGYTEFTFEYPSQL